MINKCAIIADVFYVHVTVHRNKFLYNKIKQMHQFPQIYSGMKIYMFRAVPLSIIRSLFTVRSALVYVTQVCRQVSSRTRTRMVLVLLESCLQTCMTYTITERTVNKLLMMGRGTARNV